MAAEVNGVGNVEVSPWLKSMPVAPEYHPSLAEFQDPIAYIFKIEKEASKYGICKIVPPVSAAPRKTVVANFNKSLLARSTDPESGPCFTTRQQQVGFCPRKHRPVQKPVWQSGEKYTLAEFEAKAKFFEKSYLKKCAKKGLNALEMETLYWNAMVDKPFPVEYANDMPGSAFVARKSGGKKNESTMTVGETEWNMRKVSRENLSLLRFMKEEIPGVTSPMVYVAMMFSWFAWHVEDHDLHSMNYLHMGAGKTWYGVPREAAVAFEEVIREHGYGGEINPLVTFATLGEKTTVMSPEVLLSAGVPCCRLVQNAGEFVVTFPRAYHSGFSHGFNCGEAANVATPEWLRVAREAAIRRAAINCPPMVSHFQLLYDLALSLCTRQPKNVATEPRSSRLKDRKKGEGDRLIKELFFQDMMQNNDMLHTLGRGSSIVLLPQNSLSRSICSNRPAVFQSTVKSRLFPSLCSPDLELKVASCNVHGDFMVDRKQSMKQVKGYAKNRGAVSSPMCSSSSVALSVAPQSEQMDSESRKASQSEQGLFSCVTCGILCFACVAIVQPTEAAAHYLMSADCSIFNSWVVSDNGQNHIRDANAPHKNLRSELVLREMQNGLFDVPMSADQLRSAREESVVMISNSKACKEPSSLGLLALAYGNSSDSEEDETESDIPVTGCGTIQVDYSPEDGHACDKADSKINCRKEISLQISDSNSKFRLPAATYKEEESQYVNYYHALRTNNCTVIESISLNHRIRNQMKSRHDTSNSSTHKTEATINPALTPLKVKAMPLASRSVGDSSRLHVFCLQHAMQVEKWLSEVGGVRVFLVCHPDYPNLETQAKKVAEELGSDRIWNEISFRAATKEDEEIIRLALESENAIHGNGDWAVKLGINLFYSANLSRSPLYCKQMHYNFVIYSAFGRSSPTDSSANTSEPPEVKGRQKKIVVAGKWCGKVWMSSQAHPLLVNKDSQEQEHELGIASRADLKCERQSEVAGTSTSRICRTGRRRRKNNVGNSSLMKEKSLEAETMDDVSSSLVFSLTNCHEQFKRKRGSRRLKEESPVLENSDESSSQDSDSCKQIMNRGGSKRLEKETKKEMKKESFEAECSQESSEEFPLSNCCKQIKSKHSLKNQQRSKKQHDSLIEDDELEGGPSTRLRKRSKPCKDSGPRLAITKQVIMKQQRDVTMTKKGSGIKICNKSKIKDEAEYGCDIEGCTMSFGLKQELALHKRNICPVRGCGKKFFSHKYLVQHRRVHMDDRPLKCPWKGCKMTFKWAWARTEHIRVHTGARPYVCTEAGCGQTFRFVSDFSRHKRKTGHSPKKARG
ncbi:lysine-specific demethylase ref6 [Phtheirospermum japonicum]|uniref:Lysine-specific demethylase ref6 n=1 Tax=Phtheirospermum japonicum TaxID=374723 RepID=A0A830D3F8_9LAMI|nr:lysine-specific demethylase ref6 [Phtheirospermum japonicum]